MVLPTNAIQKMSKEKGKKKIFFWSLLLPNLFREGAHMGKIRLEKRKRQKKNRIKTERAALHHTNVSFVWRQQDQQDQQQLEQQQQQQ